MLDNKLENFTGVIPANILDAFSEFITHVYVTADITAFYNQRSHQCGVFIEDGRIVMSDAKNLIQFHSSAIKASEPAKIYFPAELLKTCETKRITIYNEDGEPDEMEMFPRPDKVVLSDRFAFVSGFTEKEDSLILGTFFNGDVSNHIAGDSWRVSRANFKPINHLLENLTKAEHTHGATFFPSFIFKYLGKALETLMLFAPTVALNKKDKFIFWELVAGDFVAIISSSEETK